MIMSKVLLLIGNILNSGLENEEESRPALGEFLERLCLVLYDSLRPLIIHVTHLETLAELTAILRNEVFIIVNTSIIKCLFIFSF